MPYIMTEDRKKFDRALNALPEGSTVGERNYLITRIIDRDFQERGTNYTNINEWIGVLECVKLELYRRVATPYEDKKREENGDVYYAKS